MSDYATGAKQQAATVHRRTDPALDLSQLLRRCMGNERLARCVANKFSDRLRVDLAELESAFQRNDMSHIQSVAHRVKGTAANVAAPSIRRIAETIEEQARRCDVSELARSLSSFDHESKQLARLVGSGSRSFRTEDSRGDA